MRIEGVSEVMRYFSQAPEEVSKSIKKALRAACSGEVRNLKGQVPRWARGLVKSSVEREKRPRLVPRVLEKLRNTHKT